MHKGIIYLLLLMLMVIWGFNVIAIKLLVEHFPPLFITSLRIFTASIIAISFILVKKKMKQVTIKQVYQILLAASLGVVGHHTFLAFGLQNTSASNGGLILGLVPLTTAIFSVLFLGNKLTKLKATGFGLGIAGVCFIVLNGESSLSIMSIGDLYILGAVVTQALSFIVIRKLSDDMDSGELTSLMLLFGSIFLLLSSLFVETNQLPSLQDQPMFIWFVFIGSAVFATGLGHLVYNYGMYKLGAGETAIFINLTPFFAIVGATLFLDEVITTFQIFGFLFIVSGVLLGTGTIESYLVKRSLRQQQKIVEEKRSS